MIELNKIIKFPSSSFIHLYMVWSQDDPATETVTEIDDGHTEAEANHIG